LSAGECSEQQAERRGAHAGLPHEDQVSISNRDRTPRNRTAPNSI
jgi:hypothetical protein